MAAGLPKGETYEKIYPLDFKREVAKQALEIGDTNIVARKNKLNGKMIYRWIKEYKQGKYDIRANYEENPPA
jgi:transposase-like protein